MTAQSWFSPTMNPRIFELLTADDQIVAVLRNVHRRQTCEGRPCVIHRPSHHRMHTWPLNVREDADIIERLCSHGIGHPDPDAVAFRASIGDDTAGVHGCDGCCRQDGAIMRRAIRYVPARDSRLWDLHEASRRDDP